MFAYHFTHQLNVPQIMDRGLIPGHQVETDRYEYLRKGMSGRYRDEFSHCYPGWPVFLALPNSDLEYLFHNEFAVLEVDITDYPLFPDLPTFSSEFVDMFWEKPKLTGYKAYTRLKEQKPINPTDKDSRKLIEITRTIAVPHLIPPERIKSDVSVYNRGTDGKGSDIR